MTVILFQEHLRLNQREIKVLGLFGCISIILTLIALEILKMFTNSSYFQAMYIIPAIAGGIYLTALYNIFGNVLIYKKKSKYIMFGTLLTAIMNLLLNYIFIKMFGYMSAAYTTLFSFVILSLLQGLMTRLVYGIEIFNKKIMYIISLLVVTLNLLCILLFEHYILRTIVIFFILIGLVMKRKQIVSNLKNK